MAKAGKKSPAKKTSKASNKGLAKIVAAKPAAPLAARQSALAKEKIKADKSKSKAAAGQVPLKPSVLPVKAKAISTVKGQATASALKGTTAAVAEEKSAPDVQEAAVAPKKKRANKAAEAGERLNQMGQKWTLLFRKSQEIQAKPYNMRQIYEAKTPILHKLLGWGYILNNKNDRLEVLFKDGIRFLISNYKT